MMNGSDAAALGRNPSARAAGPRWAVLGRCSARWAEVKRKKNLLLFSRSNFNAYFLMNLNDFDTIFFYANFIQ